MRAGRQQVRHTVGGRGRILLDQLCGSSGKSPGASCELKHPSCSFQTLSNGENRQERYFAVTRLGGGLRLANRRKASTSRTPRLSGESCKYRLRSFLYRAASPRVTLHGSVFGVHLLKVANEPLPHREQWPNTPQPPPGAPGLRGMPV